jgi:serine/threonine-protein kinase
MRGDDEPNAPRAQNTPEATPTAERTAEPTDTPTAEPTDTPTPDPTDTPTPDPTDTPTPDPTKEASGEPDLKAATTAQLAGYNARRAGDYETALAKAREAQQLCGGAKELSPCGYALFEEGAALNALGRPQEAIAPLQRRLNEYGDNESGEVSKELRKAEKAAKKAEG